jgi:mannitol/fructose-specific phosphotransferase system IIA component (Ntr-type)
MGVTMRLTEILDPACIKVPLASTGKQDALFELVELLGGCGAVTEVQQLKDAVWQRELTRTTGIGHGIGIPHGKTGCLDALHMAIGLPPAPIEFGAIDGKPVELIILLASPSDQTGPHIQALAKISRMLTDEAFRVAVKKAESAEQLYDMLIQHEAQLAGA